MLVFRGVTGSKDDVINDEFRCFSDSFGFEFLNLVTCCKSSWFTFPPFPPTPGPRWCEYPYLATYGHTDTRAKWSPLLVLLGFQVDGYLKVVKLVAGWLWQVFVGKTEGGRCPLNIGSESLPNPWKFREKITSPRNNYHPKRKPYESSLPVPSWLSGINSSLERPGNPPFKRDDFLSQFQ